VLLLPYSITSDTEQLEPRYFQIGLRKDYLIFENSNRVPASKVAHLVLYETGED